MITEDEQITDQAPSGRWGRAERAHQRGRLSAVPRGAIPTLIFLFVLVQGMLLVTDAQLPNGHVLEYPNLRSPGEIYALIDCYTDKGAGCYKEGSRDLYLWSKVVLDGLYPIIYATLLSLLLIRASETGRDRSARRAERLGQVLALLPFVAMASDYLENASIVVMLTSTGQPTWLAQALVILTDTKWGVIGISVVSLALVWVWGLLNPVSTGAKARAVSG